ncbi:aldo/keto reductase [Agromyces mangrovi Wang et al. 2018]|uniref:aldo/keto reductase n=1 Tax=Agromyces mangrovi TaxID=1858653 RepID=UPI002573353C|nr:aldo/keto reductase [Agromyces mangrovi]BDZ64426.1 oxidoreductase [Agromyces mangrovi]
MNGTSVKTRRIGESEVSAVGLGGVQWSLVDEPDEARSIATIHAAIDAGITLIDTAHAYTTLDEESHNERMVATALAAHPDRERVLVATKGGHWRTPDGMRISNDRSTLRRHLETSLRTLGVERIGLYQLHHPDPQVPVEEAVGTLADFQRDGLVEHIGVSNFDLEQLERARSVAAIASVQNAYSPLRLADQPVVEYAAKHGLSYLAHSPFGGRGRSGRFLDSLPNTRALATELGIPLHVFVLAWLLHRNDAIIPIPGAGRPRYGAGIADAIGIELSDAEAAVLDAEAVPGDWLP